MKLLVFPASASVYEAVIPAYISKSLLQVLTLFLQIFEDARTPIAFPSMPLSTSATYIKASHFYLTSF